MARIAQNKPNVIKFTKIMITQKIIAMIWGNQKNAVFSLDTILVSGLDAKHHF